MALKYTYCDKNLFKEPELYHYADCENADFLPSWRNSRENKLKSIRNIERENSSSHSKSSNLNRKELGQKQKSLILILTNLNNDQDNSKDSNIILRELLKKYEVFRRLYSYYSETINRLPNSELASLDEYLLFAKVLASYAEKNKNLQYLSTLLKLVDALCSLDLKVFDESQLNSLKKIISLENRLILQWENV